MLPRRAAVAAAEKLADGFAVAGAHHIGIDGHSGPVVNARERRRAGHDRHAAAGLDLVDHRGFAGVRIRLVGGQQRHQRRIGVQRAGEAFQRQHRPGPLLRRKRVDQEDVTRRRSDLCTAIRSHKRHAAARIGIDLQPGALAANGDRLPGRKPGSTDHRELLALDRRQHARPAPIGAVCVPRDERLIRHGEKLALNKCGNGARIHEAVQIRRSIEGQLGGFAGQRIAVRRDLLDVGDAIELPLDVR